MHLVYIDRHRSGSCLTGVLFPTAAERQPQSDEKDDQCFSAESTPGGALLLSTT
jgi:hypothetical protein